MKPAQLHPWRRWQLFGLGLALLSGFGLSLWLEPDPRGFGTHQQLGLPPCTFYSIFGFSCPSCGGTTCFAHFVRGNWIAAASANPAIFLLAVVCALTVPWCFWCSWSGRYWIVHRPEQFALLMSFPFCLVAGLFWLFRIISS